MRWVFFRCVPHSSMSRELCYVCRCPTSCVMFVEGVPQVVFAGSVHRVVLC